MHTSSAPRDIQPITAAYDVTLDDLVAFNLYHWHHSPALRRQLFVTRLVLALVTAALTLFAMSRVPPDEPLSSFAYVLAMLAGVIVFFIYPLSADASIRKRTVNLAQEGKNMGMLGHQQLALTPEAVRCQSPAGDATMRWSSIERIATTDDHTFIYVSALSALVIPARAFPTKAAYDTFIGMAQDYQCRSTTSHSIQ